MPHMPRAVSLCVEFIRDGILVALAEEEGDMVLLASIDGKVSAVRSGGGAKRERFTGVDLVFFGVHDDKDG